VLLVARMATAKAMMLRYKRGNGDYWALQGWGVKGRMFNPGG